MACAARCGSILPGWVDDCGVYRPRRWSRDGCWQVSHTEVTGSGSGIVVASPGGPGEDEDVGVDVQLRATPAGRRRLVGGHNVLQVGKTGLLGGGDDVDRQGRVAVG